MNILITCQTPPGFGHPDLYRLNINTYKRNKTRKNSTKKNLIFKGDRVYYIDTHYTDIPETTPNWFSKWDMVPDKSMDYIWGHNCPIFGPLGVEELYTRLSEFTEPTEAHFLEEDNKFWRDVLKHGKRILKDGGKIVFPLPQIWKGWISDPIQILLIARIINMEVSSDFLYKVSIVNSLSGKHTSYLNDMFILNNNNFGRKLNGNSRVLNLDEAFKFLVFENP